MARESYIKLYRKLLNNPIVCKDADHLAVWIWLLLNAAPFPRRVIFGGKPMRLEPGQLTTGRKVIADALGINEHKVQRVLKCFETAQQIAQQTDHRCRLITILSWSEYQGDAQADARLLHNYCTTDAQLMHTNKERRERKERKTISTLNEDEGLMNDVRDFRKRLGLPVESEVDTLL